MSVSDIFAIVAGVWAHPPNPITLNPITAQRVMFMEASQDTRDARLDAKATRSAGFRPAPDSARALEPNQMHDWETPPDDVLLLPVSRNGRKNQALRRGNRCSA